MTNYNVIKTLKSDLKKVAPVLSLSESLNNASDSQQEDVFKQWQAAYQCLSAKQISLYNVLGGTELVLE